MALQSRATQMVDKPELLDEGPAADYIGMSAAFLRAGRCKGVVGNHTPPPAHLKLGRSIKYDRRDLDQWLADRRVDPVARRRRDRHEGVAA
ncbi:MAG: DNA-binding protein [Steroidobacteraceae bacterium]